MDERPLVLMAVIFVQLAPVAATMAIQEFTRSMASRIQGN